MKNYFLLIAALFYQTIQAQDTVNQDTAQLQEVVVTGQYSPQTLRKSVYKIRTIDRERMIQRGVTNLMEALNMETGVRFSTDQTLGETDINLMGVSGQNVKILLNGIPLVDRGSTRQSLSQIDINQIERIEIVEGPMSVIYGTDALAGVINIITRKNGKGEEWNVTARLLEETTGKHYSPFHDFGVHNAGVTANWQRNGWNASGSFSRNSFGGWTGNAQFPAMEARPKDQFLGAIQIGKQTANTNTWYRVDGLKEKITVVGPMNPNNYRGKDQYYLTDRFTHQLQQEWRIKPRLNLQTSASYQHYVRNTETYQLDYTNGGKTPVYGPGEWDRSTFQTAFLRSTLSWYMHDKLAIQPGIEWKYDKTTGERISGTPSISDYSFFLTGEWKPTERIQIKPGIRISKNSVYDAPPVIPSINTKFSLGNKADLRISYARGFRAPILRELYFYYFDANHSIQGNTNLKAETSDSYIATLSWYGAEKPIRWKTAVSLFYNDFKNRIGMAAGQNNIFTYINIDRFKTVGVGLEQTMNVGDLKATLGFLYTGRYNRYASEVQFSGNDLPEFVWSPEVNSQLQYSFPKLGATVGLFYKFTGTMPNYQVTINSNNNQEEVYLSKLASYHWADITATKKIGSAWTVQLGAKNLFNVNRLQSINIISGIHTNGTPIITGYGRSMFAGITYTISSKYKTK